MKPLRFLNKSFPLILMALQAFPAHGQSLFHDLPWSPAVWMVSCRGCSQLMHLKTVKTIAEPGVVSNEDWSPDGKYIAIGIWSESHINVYDTENWKLLGSLAVQNDNEGRGVKFLMNDDLIIPAVAAGDRLNTIPNLDDNVSAEEWNFKKKLIVKKFRTSFTYDKNAQEFSRTLTPVDVQWARVETHNIHHTTAATR